MSIKFYDDALVEKVKRWTGDTELHIYSPSDTQRLFEVIQDQNGDKDIRLPILCIRRSGGYSILNINKRPLTYDGSTLQSIDGWVIYNNGKEISECFISYDAAYDRLQEIRDTYPEAVVERIKNGKSIQLNAVPIQINYQIDIYTRYLHQADEYMRNLVFNVINYPTLKVTLPYNDTNFTHNGTIRIGQDIEDNSDVPERMISGQFTRLTASINLDDAYLWDIRDRDNRYIADVAVDAD